MKISPIVNPGSIPSTLQPSGVTASAQKLAQAKVIAAGEVGGGQDPQVERAQNAIRTLKMRTNVTPSPREYPPLETHLETPPEAQPAVPNPVETEEPTIQAEVTKPLSPQLAALAKQRRALQVKEQELAAREKALTEAVPSNTADVVARLKADPLSVLQEAGVTYDQLTKEILAVNPEVDALKREIKALKEGIDKNFSDRDTQAEQQVLAEIRRDADRLSQTGDTYELIRATRNQPAVVELIKRTWKETGEVLDTEEAMNLVETDLINEHLKLARLAKISSRLVPATDTKEVTNTGTMTTLTNRDGASPILDRKARAMAAALGQLKR